MPSRLVTMREGFARMRMSHAEYYRRRKLNPGDAKYDPLLPKIIKPLGRDSKASALLEAEIDQYIGARIAERDAGQVTYTTPEIIAGEPPQAACLRSHHLKPKDRPCRETKPGPAGGGNRASGDAILGK